MPSKSVRRRLARQRQEFLKEEERLHKLEAAQNLIKMFSVPENKHRFVPIILNQETAISCYVHGIMAGHRHPSINSKIDYLSKMFMLLIPKSKTQEAKIKCECGSKHWMVKVDGVWRRKKDKRVRSSLSFVQ